MLLRAWNEENRDYEVRRAQLYMVQGFILGNYILGVKTLVTMLYNQMITRDRYVRDTYNCLLYTSPSPRDATLSRMPSSA